MDWITEHTFDHLPDMHLHGPDHNGTERHIGVEAGRLVGDAALVTRLQLMLERGEEVRVSPDEEYLAAGLEDPFQAYLTLRALFQHVSDEQVPESVFAAQG